MMPLPPDAPLSVRLGARLGPEIVASMLVAVVAVVGIAVFLSGRQAPGPGPAATVVPSVAVRPSASPGGSPTAPPSVAARAVLEVVDRLLGQRTALQAAVADSSSDAVAIADLLRDINASLVVQDGLLAELAGDPATRDLALRIRTVDETAADAVRRTQRASISNEKAYRTGGGEVVATLEPLVGIRAELAIAAGVAETPPATLAQPGGSSEPSGSTP